MELRKYQSFESVEEMDGAINEALKLFDLNESQRTVLFTLSKYSCKYVGVSYLKTKTLADATSLSQRTVQRALKHLCDLNIITRIKRFKIVSGGFTSSLTIINQPSLWHIDLSYCKDGEKADVTRVAPSDFKKETITLKASNSLKERESELDYSYVYNSNIPDQFIDAVKPFFKSAKEVYKLWGKVLLAEKLYCNGSVFPIDLAVSSFKNTVFMYKRGRIKKTFFAYFFGVLSKNASWLARKISKVSGVFNWSVVM